MIERVILITCYSYLKRFTFILLTAKRKLLTGIIPSTDPYLI